MLGVGASYTEDFDRLIKDGSSDGASLCEGFREGDVEGGHHYWGIIRKMRFFGDMQNACKWISLPLGVLSGNLEGVPFPGLLTEKKSISGFLSWTRRPLRF
jgi:hypothetical protein